MGFSVSCFVFFGGKARFIGVWGLEFISFRRIVYGRRGLLVVCVGLGFGCG